MFEVYFPHQARVSPNTLAFAFSDGSITYRRFAADVHRVARRLADENLAPLSMVAVKIEGVYLHWLVVMAAIQLNLPTVSLHDDPELAAMSLRLADPDVLVTDQAGVEASGRVLMFDRTWLEGPPIGLHTDPLSPYAPTDPVRLMLSSGTTGTPKKILFDRELMDFRFTALAPLNTRRSGRVGSTMPPSTMGGFTLPLTAWAARGTVVHAKWSNPALDLAVLRPTDLMMAPTQLRAFLRGLPSGFEPVYDLCIWVGGSTVSKALFEETATRLTANVQIVYGSTEAGGIASGHASLLDLHPNACGYVNPIVEVETVGPDGSVLAPGKLGELRFRTARAVTRYEGDTDTESTAFRDGWFYPGDAGYVIDPGVLVVTGRVSELMTIDGEVLAPDPIEDLVRLSPLVEDVAAFALPSATDGSPQLHLAVVAAQDVKADALTADVAARSGRPARVLRVSKIPRNAMGKVQRELLKQALSEQLATAAKQVGKPRSAGSSNILSSDDTFNF